MPNKTIQLIACWISFGIGQQLSLRLNAALKKPEQACHAKMQRLWLI